MPANKNTEIPSTLPSSVLDVSEDEIFLEFVSETKKDMEMGPCDPDFLDSMENILQTERLTLLNVGHLFQYIHDLKESPSGYDEMRDEVIPLLGEEKANFVVETLKKEHAYMHNIVSKGFSINSSPEGPFAVSVKVNLEDSPDTEPKPR